MQFELNKTYHGFTLLEEKEIKEVNSIARLFRHEKSGAELFHLENEDDNKVFSISFRTPPADSTGLPHILEHSVLCGSRKFPAKEPFVELIKGSLNTYLNASTYPDKTMYPVASKNEKDFYNLMDVYLDAVFYPNIYKKPEILMQEGWHYELDSRDSELTYKGVVYNEMKGAFSSPEQILMRKVMESLFPDTPYGLESGGDPDVIPELTYEEFVAFHKKYYHPSNSYIFLYGNGDLQQQLSFINDNYLKAFDKLEIASAIPLQKPFEKLAEMEIEYPISPDEDEKDKAYLSLNLAVGSSTDPEFYLAMDILQHLLLATPASPLKKALIDAQLGKDVFGSFDSSILQPTFSIIVKNSNVAGKDRFLEVVFDTLKGLVREGIDKKLVEASININEFHLREADYKGYPKGLIYNIKCMDSWLYGKNPRMHLEYEPVLEKIKTALKTDYFEKMIDKYLLKNTHGSILILKPRKGLGEAKNEELKKALAQYKSSLNSEQLDELVRQTQRLRELQNSPDSQDILETIPMLELRDIKPEAEQLPMEVREEQDVRILHCPVFTNNIAYVNYIFDAGAVSQEQIPYVSLLADVLGKTSTGKYSYSELSKEININTGELRFLVQVYGEKGDDSKYHPKLSVKSRALAAKLSKLFELVGEIVSSSSFDDPKRLREIIQEIKSRLEMRISNDGYIYACKRLLSYYSNEGAYVERLTGLTYYKFIADIEKNFDSRYEQLVDNIKAVSDMVFNRNTLLVNVTCEEEDYDAFRQQLPGFLNSLSGKRVPPVKYSFEMTPRNEGLMTPAKIQYVAKGYNFIKLGYKYNGALNVLNTIARYDYLWNRIRVQGGAYGAFSGFERNGNMFMASYRDPNLKETLKAYDEMEKYLRDFDADSREMTKYIIGTVSRLDTPLTPSMKGDRALEYYLRNISFEDVQRERDEVLSTSAADIRELADMIFETMKQDCICVLGNEAKIKESRELFGSLINVYE